MSFKALQREWYGRLRDSGFRDIERPDGSLADRNRFEYVAGLAPSVRRAAAEYYHAASCYLTDGEFPDSATRLVWALHCEGRTVREIAAVVQRSRQFVQRRVNGTRLAMLGALRE